ncbi:MAG: hypothetical protein ACYDCL_21470 [Myxococcales bacterium]
MTIIPRTAIHAVSSPGAAVDQVRDGNVGTEDRLPAILWLTLAILALWTFRHGRLPSGPEAALASVAIAGIVLAGSVAPRVVFWLLFAIVIAAVIGGAPAIAKFLTTFKGVTLAGPGSTTSG